MVNSDAAPSTMAASTTCPTPGSLGVDDGGQHAERQQHATATEIAHQVERGHRAIAGPPHRFEGTGQGDVVDVVTGSLRHGTCLTPAGHPSEDQPGIPSQADVRTQSEPLGDAGSEALHQPVGLLHQAKHQGDSRRAT